MSTSQTKKLRFKLFKLKNKIQNKKTFNRKYKSKQNQIQSIQIILVEIQFKFIPLTLNIDFQFKEKMISFSERKRKMLEEITESLNNPIHPNVRPILERVNNESYSLNERFKNLEDPLGFIHNPHLQNLVDKTQESASKLKKQMEDVSQFSKSMFKKIIARQGNEFDFQNIQEEGKVLQKNEIKDTQILKAQNYCKQKQSGQQIKIIQKDSMTKNIIKTQKFQSVSQYKHQTQHIKQTKRQSSKSSKVDLTYYHIKLLDTPEFDTQCKNVEFYELLKSQKPDPYHLRFQDYDIEKSPVVNRLCDKILLPLIEEDGEYGVNSQWLFYDFDMNLKFWKVASNKQANLKPGNSDYRDNETEKLTEEQVMSVFNNFSKKQINSNNICDLAMGKISPDHLKHYMKLKKQHKLKLRPGRNDEDLQQQYQQLKKQYDQAHELKMKSRSQRIPVKYTDSDCQTIKILEQTDFDDYFHEDFKQLFNQISKLNQVRENAMSNKTTKNRFVVIKNACYDINECLFKLLTLILKGEKFYPKNKGNEQHYGPFFTYRDLFDVEKRDQVQKKILELIYSKVEEFQCEFVDGIAKSDLIAIYIQEREKTNRILDIVAQQ